MKQILHNNKSTPGIWEFSLKPSPTTYFKRNSGYIFPCLFISYKVDGIMNIALFLFFACIQPEGRTFTFPDLTEHRASDQKVVDVVGEFCSPGSTFCAEFWCLFHPCVTNIILLKWLLFLADLFGMILVFVTDHFLSVLCNQ